jgi:hypothetical protein
MTASPAQWQNSSVEYLDQVGFAYRNPKWTAVPNRF